MLKWTLSQKSSSCLGDSDKNASNYQIKRASVRVLRRDRDKENCDPLLRRLMALARRGGSNTAASKTTNKSHPLDPRRIFSLAQPDESDSGSVYMRLDRMPAAVSHRDSNHLAEVTNTLGQSRSPGTGSEMEPIYGRLGLCTEPVDRRSVARHSFIKKFTDRPSNDGLRRPVAVKGDSPEAQGLSSAHQGVAQTTSMNQTSSTDVCSNTESERRQLKMASRRILGNHLLNLHNTVHTHQTSSASKISEHHHRPSQCRFKPTKKACVRIGNAVHAHTTTGQHIHPAGCLETQSHLTTSAPLSISTPAVKTSTAKVYSLPAIREQVEDKVISGQKSVIPERQQLLSSVGTSAVLPSNSVLNRHSSIMKHIKEAVSTEINSKRFNLNCCCQHANESVVLAQNDMKHDISLERGDSGISEGVTSPTNELNDSNHGGHLLSAEESQTICDSYYFSKYGHWHTDPSVLDASTISRKSVSPNRRKRRNSIVAPFDVVNTSDTANVLGISSLKRSHSFSDASVVSSSNRSGHSNPFAENSGETVIENPNSAHKRSFKFVRFMQETDAIASRPKSQPRNRGTDVIRKPLQDLQLYRSYQNIGSVFTGSLSCKSRQYKCPPTYKHCPPFSNSNEHEETYLTMRVPIKKSISGDVNTLANTPSANTTCDKSESQNIVKKQPTSPERIYTIEHIVNVRLQDKDSVDCTTGDVTKTVPSNTLTDTMSLLSLTEDDSSRRSLSWCSVSSRSSSPLPSAVNGMVLHHNTARRSLDAVFNPTYISPECRLSVPQTRHCPSENSTLDSWCSHRGSLRFSRPPLANSEACPMVSTTNSNYDLEMEVEKTEEQHHGHHRDGDHQRRGTVRSVKNRGRHRPRRSASRIWRHPRQENNHSTPNRPHRLAYSTCSSVLGPEDTYLNAMSFTRSADSSLATSGWLSISGKKGRRVVSTQWKRQDVSKPRGQVKVRVYENSGLMTVHVVRARSLSLRSGDVCNAYVKISLVPDCAGRSFCRTSIVYSTNQPVFDERFSFEFLEEDRSKRLLVSLWHRNIRRSSSEFLGCTSFGVRNLMTSEIGGWFRLLPENVGRKKHFAVRHRRRTEPSALDIIDLSICDDTSVMAIASTSPSFPHRSQLATVDNLRLSPVPPPLPARGIGRLTCSQSASAVPCPDSAPAHDVRRTCSDSVLTGRAPAGGGVRRALAPSNHRNGSPLKAPYHRFRIRRGPRGFGLSLAWTCPPSVVSVEPLGSAATVGLAAGDYVVRIGSRNVVLMNHSSGLELIRRQGSELDLVVYRPEEASSTSLMELLRWI